MAGVEAGLVLGLISSVITILEAAQEIYEATQDIKGLPKKFRTAAEQIPLIYHALTLSEQNIRAMRVNEQALQSAKLVLEQCQEIAARVKDVFDKTIPGPNASTSERLKKAVGLKMKSKKVKEDMEELAKSMELLAQHQVFEDTAMLQKIQEAIEQLNNLPDEEEQPQFVHFGAGAINANTGLGTQENYNNSGLGSQYNAKTQNFGRDQVEKQTNLTILSNFQEDPFGDARDLLGRLSLTKHSRTQDTLRQRDPWQEPDEKTFLHTLEQWTADNIGDTVSDPMVGTCTWILEKSEYNSWRRSNGSSIMFITGNSGSGKSCLAKFISSDLRKDGSSTVIEFYYRNIQASNNEPPFFNYLVHKLLCEDRRNFQHVFPKYGSHSAQLKNPSAATLQNVASAILKGKLTQAEAKPLFIIIDGLDECQPRHAQRILETFDSIVTAIPTDTQHTPVRVMIISQRINLVMGMASKHTHLHITPEDTLSDVKSFVNNKMKRIAYQRGYLDGLRENVEDSICRSAHGYFLWVTCVLADLENPDKDISFVTIQKTIRDCLPTQSEHYKSALQSIQLRRDSVLFELLVLIVGFTEYLALPALESALSLTTSLRVHELDLRGKIFASCTKLLKIDQNDIVVLVHPSLQRYLTDSVLPEADMLDIQRICSSEETINLLVAQTCLNYLMQPKLQEALKISWESDNPDDKQKLQHDFPFLDYAARNWRYHVRQIPKLTPELVRLVGSFFLRVHLNDKSVSRGPYSTFDLIDRYQYQPQPEKRSKKSASVLCYLASYNLGNVLEASVLTEEHPSPLTRLMRHIPFRPLKIEIAENLDVYDAHGLAPLHAAAVRGSVKALNVLLSMPGARVNQRAQDRLRSTALHLARGHGSVSTLLKAEADPNIVDEDGQTVMHMIADHVDTEELSVTIRCLVKFHARLDILDHSGHYPLCYALDVEDIDDNSLLLLLDNSPSKRCPDAACSIFFRVVKKGRDALLKELINRTAAEFIDQKDGNGLNALHYALLERNVEAVKLLVQHGACVETMGQLMTSGREVRPLELAIVQQDLPSVKILLEGNANPYSRSSDNRSMLSLAIKSGSLSILETLLKADADPNSRDGFGQTPLFYASYTSQDIQAVEILLNAGAEICPNKGVSSILNPLHAAAYHGNDKAVSLLLGYSSHGEINAHDAIRRSPLFLACMGGYTKTAELLLDAGACVVQEEDKDDKIMSIVPTVDKDLFRLLLHHGADPTCGSNGDWSTFHSSAEAGSLPLFLELAGTTPLKDVCELKSHSGATPLLIACAHGHVTMVRCLVGLGAEITATNNDGSNLIHAACESGNVELVQYVEHVSQGILSLANVTNDGSTTLFVACSKNKLEVAKYLIGKNIDPNKLTNTRLSCLHRAAIGGNTELCLMLLKRHADINAVSSDGMSVLQAAALCRDELRKHQTIQVLLQHSIDLTFVSPYDGGTALFCLFSCPTINSATLNLFLSSPATELLHQAKNGQTILHYALSRNLSREAAQIARQAWLYDGIGQLDPLTKLLQIRDGWGRTVSDILFSQGICTEQTTQDAWRYQRAQMRVAVSDMILQLIEQAAGLESPSNLFSKLGPAMVSFGDEDEAKFWCRRSVFLENGYLTYPASCNRCYEVIMDNRYLCRVCEDTDLCEKCLWQVVRGQDSTQHCRNHSFYKISTEEISSGEEPLDWEAAELQPKLEALAEKYRLLRKVMVTLAEREGDVAEDDYDHKQKLLHWKIFAGMNLPLKLQLMAYPYHRRRQSNVKDGVE